MTDALDRNPVSYTNDLRILNAVQRIENAAIADSDGNPWVVTEINRRNGYVFVRVICTFKFPLEAPTP
jgi:hypothetical protein